MIAPSSLPAIAKYVCRERVPRPVGFGPLLCYMGSLRGLARNMMIGFDARVTTGAHVKCGSLSRAGLRMGSSPG